MRGLKVCRQSGIVCRQVVPAHAGIKGTADKVLSGQEGGTRTCGD